MTGTNIPGHNFHSMSIHFGGKVCTAHNSTTLLSLHYSSRATKLSDDIQVHPNLPEFFRAQDWVLHSKPSIAAERLPLSCSV